MIYDEIWIDVNKFESGYAVAARRNEQIAQLKVIVINNGKKIDNTAYTLKFIGNNAKGELTDGTAYRQNSEGTYLYTFSKQNLAVAGKFRRAYFELRDTSNRKITSCDFALKIIDEADVTADQATVHVTQLDQLVKEHDKQLSSQKKDFEDYSKQQKDEWGNFVDQNKDILESIDPGGKILNELNDATIAEDGTVYNSLQDRLNTHNVFVEVDEEIRKVFNKDLDALKASVKQENFNLGINTDCHYEDTQNLSQYSAMALGLSHVHNILYCGDVLDAIVFAGDNVHGDAINLAAIKKQHQTFADLALTSDASCDVFLTVGNHDDGSGRKKNSLIGDTLTFKDIIHESEFKAYYKTANRLFDEVRNGDSLYCFKDYPKKGVRLIVLNSSDIPENITEPGNTKLQYLRFLAHSYSQAQISWLCDVALRDVPEDYHVIIVQHTPLQFGWDLGTSKYYNHDLMLGILKAFRDGGAYSGVGLTADFPAVVNVDFSSQGPRVFCGVFSGHLHNEKNYLVDDINNSTLLNSAADKESRVIDTVQEDAFSILEIDKAARQVRIHGFGAAQDRSISY